MFGAFGYQKHSGYDIKYKYITDFDVLDDGKHLSPSYDLWYGNHGFIFNE